MRRDLQAMGRVGSWRFASQVENPGASPQRAGDFAARGCYPSVDSFSCYSMITVLI